LTNVALNVSKIKEKDLPVCVYAGSCASLELTIPWTALATQPVKVLVRGVNLLAGPLDPKQVTPAAARQRARDAARAKLDAGDRAHLALLAAQTLKAAGGEALADDDEAKDPGWAASLVMKIVDNIQVNNSRGCLKKYIAALRSHDLLSSIMLGVYSF
jgi:vacuolar protein sorting-associated protein 13A/C